MKRIMIGLVMASLMLTGVYAEEEHSGWLTDFEQARKLAKEKKLPILADFAGSDWCGWCIKLDKEVFTKEEFKKYAKDNLVLFLADFPNKKK
ncbi:thioredoxin family protein, partial [Verrucomicrobiota bacterium]